MYSFQGEHKYKSVNIHKIGLIKTFYLNSHMLIFNQQRMRKLNIK